MSSNSDFLKKLTKIINGKDKVVQNHTVFNRIQILPLSSVHILLFPSSFHIDVTAFLKYVNTQIFSQRGKVRKMTLRKRNGKKNY